MIRQSLNRKTIFSLKITVILVIIIKEYSTYFRIAANPRRVSVATVSFISCVLIKMEGRRKSLKFSAKESNLCAVHICDQF